MQRNINIRNVTIHDLLHFGGQPIVVNLPIGKNRYVELEATITKAKNFLTEKLTALTSYCQQIETSPTKKAEWIKNYGASELTYTNVIQIPKTALFQILNDYARELIKNAIDANCSAMEIGFIHLNNDILCLIKHRNVAEFPGIKKGTCVDYLQLVGKDAHAIQSAKEKRKSAGGCGIALLMLAKTLQNYAGNLYISSDDPRGVTIKLMAPKKELKAEKIQETKADFNSYTNRDPQQPTIVKNMLQNFQTPGAGNSASSSTTHSIISTLKTAEAKPKTLETLAPTTVVDQLPVIKESSISRPITPPPLVRNGADEEILLTDEAGDIKTIISYPHQMLLEFGDNNILAKKIFYGINGKPTEMRTYQPTLLPGKSRNEYFVMNMGAWYRGERSGFSTKTIPYKTPLFKTVVNFFPDGSSTLKLYNNKGSVNRDIRFGPKQNP